MCVCVPCVYAKMLMLLNIHDESQNVTEKSLKVSERSLKVPRGSWEVLKGPLIKVPKDP